MLNCLKPKNNQSLNRILLVLIKKKELVQWVRGTGQISWEKCQPQLWLSSS